MFGVVYHADLGMLTVHFAPGWHQLDSLLVPGDEVFVALRMGAFLRLLLRFGEGTHHRVLLDCLLGHGRHLVQVYSKMLLRLRSSRLSKHIIRRHCRFNHTLRCLMVTVRIRMATNLIPRCWKCWGYVCFLPITLINDALREVEISCFYCTCRQHRNWLCFVMSLLILNSLWR